MAEPHPETHPDVLSEIATKGDFPAAARVIQRLNDSVRRDDCKTIVVARTILQDPGLSSKVLRLVNSVLYRTAESRSPPSAAPSSCSASTPSGT